MSNLEFSAEIRMLTTPQELFAAAAEEVVRTRRGSGHDRGRFAIALSGGSTPKSLYNLLATNARTALPWDRMFFFLGDERHVPPTDPESNYRMADETMLSKIPVPPANMFRVEAENPDAAAAAEAYEQTLAESSLHLNPDEFPRFDLILLGMGPDGHTASLFPGTAALARKISPGGCQLGREIQDAPPHLHPARTECGARVAFLVSGTDKAPAVKTVLEERCSRRAISLQSWSSRSTANLSGCWTAPPPANFHRA